MSDLATTTGRTRERFVDARPEFREDSSDNGFIGELLGYSTLVTSGGLAS